MTKYLSYSLAIFFVLFSCKNEESQSAATDKDPWDLALEIENAVVPPEFPEQSFNIMDYGAKEDPAFNNSQAFVDAIAACHEAGGGRIIVPKGNFLTSPIHLLDNVNLHLEEGATVKFSQDKKDFLPLVHTSYEGTELMNYSPLVYAFGKKNIALTGKGTLDGQASNTNWWWMCGKDSYGWKEGMPTQKDSFNLPYLKDMAEKGEPVEARKFGEGHHLRPTFVEFFECENILIQGVKIVNAPFWVLHPIKSENITVDGIRVESHGPNNDGCDPEYCKNVVIKNCYFNTGDDCIAIKSGRNADGRRVGIKSERILVKDCQMLDGHGGVVMGSEISAGVSDVFVENCNMDSPNLDRAIRIKTNTKRGGFVENVYVRNIEVGQVKEAVLKVNLFYGIYGKQEGEFIPTVRNINLENVNVKNGGKYAILARGREQAPIKDITFKNVVIEKVNEKFLLENVEGLTLINTYINGELAQNPLK